MTLRERLTSSVTDIRERAQRLAQLNRELLASELKQKGGRFAGAFGVFAGAGLFALYAVGFALATIAVALKLFLPLWLSLLIVTVLLFVVVAIMLLVGRSLLRQAQTPAPRAATAEAKTTAELIRANLRETAAGVRTRAGRKPGFDGGVSQGPSAVPDVAPAPQATTAPDVTVSPERPSAESSQNGASGS